MLQKQFSSQGTNQQINSLDMHKPVLQIHKATHPWYTLPTEDAGGIDQQPEEVNAYP